MTLCPFRPKNNGKKVKYDKITYNKKNVKIDLRTFSTGTKEILIYIS